MTISEGVPWCVECEQHFDRWDVRWCWDGRLRCYSCLTTLIEQGVEVSDADKKAAAEAAANAEERAKQSRPIPQRHGPEEPNDKGTADGVSEPEGEQPVAAEPENEE